MVALSDHSLSQRMICFNFSHYAGGKWETPIPISGKTVGCDLPSFLRSLRTLGTHALRTLAFIRLLKGCYWSGISVTSSPEFPKTADPLSLGVILSFACKRDGPIWPLMGWPQLSDDRAPPSWKLAVRGAKALNEGTGGDSNGDSDSLHTTHTQVPSILAVSTRKRAVRRTTGTEGRISGYWLNMPFERTQTIAEDENET